MNYLILVSHGELAGGMHTAVKMMCGEREDVLSTSLKDGMSTDDFRKNFEQLLERVDLSTDKIYLIADIQGGSPFTTSVDVLANKGILNDSIVLSGMNLSMCVTASIMKDVLSNEDFVEQVLAEATGAIAHFTVSDANEDEEI